MSDGDPYFDKWVDANSIVAKQWYCCDLNGGGPYFDKWFSGAVIKLVV